MTTFSFYRHRRVPAFRLVLRAGDEFPSETHADDWEQTRVRQEEDISTDVLSDVRSRGYALFMLGADFSQIPPSRSRRGDSGNVGSALLDKGSRESAIGTNVDPVETLTLRPAEGADSSMLYALHKATMRQYVEAIYGPWDDDVQFARHEEWLQRSHPQVIQCGGEPVGVIDWVWRDHDLYLGRIEVRPDLQGSGIGTRVLRHLAAKAAGRSKPLVLEVIDINPARRLYERLGFEPFKRVGRKIHLRMNTAAIDLSKAAEIDET